MAPTKKETLSLFMEKIWNSGEFGYVEQLVAPAYTVTEDRGDPWEGQTLDRDAFKQRVLYSRDAFPDLSFDIQHMVEEGERVAAKWMMSGTHLGDLPQLPATGAKFSIAGMTIYRFEGDQISGHIQVFDQMAFLGQIGFFPA